VSKFEDYFNKDFFDLKDKQKDIKDLYTSDEMYLISGDFYGIQKFIFEGLSTKNAAKVLRAKSAFVQLFTSVISKYICNKLEIEEKYILSTNAGKFEILSPKMNENILKEIQETINQYFIKRFYGLSGINICFVSCIKDDFEESKKYKILREKIANEIEKSKFKKFDLQTQEPILSYDENITNQTLCKVCNIRKVKDEKAKEPCCEVCDEFISLGKKLTTFKIDEIIKSNSIGIKFDDFVCDLIIDEKIKSYVAKNQKGEILEFEDFSKNSQGAEAIGILKADVDGMGLFLKKENNSVTDCFDNFDLFSKTLDNFFSLHIPRKMEKDFKNTYTVFAGGDDLFLLGSWDVILKLARFIESEFRRFVKSSELTISFGIAMAKPSKPISYLAHETEHLLENSKELEGKDAITLFGETVKWSDYKKVFAEFDSAFKPFENKEINTAFLYRLLEFCEMSKESKTNPMATIWKSKLRYSFSRNNDNLGENIYKLLDEKIDNNPKETKMFLSEFIYKRRD
jgi:CRISPR-associated protein Csm1